MEIAWRQAPDLWKAASSHGWLTRLVEEALVVNRLDLQAGLTW